jgi:hypothetical protein
MNYSYNYSFNGAAAAAFVFLIIAFYVIVAIGAWKTFAKAGRPGWSAIIPFYNIYVWVQIAGRPTSWFWVILVCMLLSWIPVLGFILDIVVLVMVLLLALDNAKNFGHGNGFGVLLWLFPYIMFLILGFGSSQYRQVANLAAVPPAPPMGGPTPPPPAPPAPPAAGPTPPPPAGGTTPPPPAGGTTPPTEPPASPAPPSSPTPPPPPLQ